MGTRPLDPGVVRFLRWIPTPVMLVVVAIWLVPSASLVIASLRDWSQVSVWWEDLFSVDTWSLDAYRIALDASANNSFVDALLNSFAIAVPATVIPVLFGAWAAYAFVFMRFRGRVALYFLLIALMAMPIYIALIPLLQAYAMGVHLTLPLVDRTVTLVPDIGLAGTIPAVWITHVGFAIPFAVFLLANSMLRLPESLVEAARVDGASHSETFWRIVFPLTLPAAAALGVLLFVFAWNDFIVALTMIGGADPSALPATVRFASISLPVGGPVTAAAVIIHSSIAIAVFVVLQRSFVKGLVASAE